MIVLSVIMPTRGNLSSAGGHDVPGISGDYANSSLHGTLHIYVAFDWGEEVNLGAARQLVPSELLSLPRKARTPSSIAYRPQPLRFSLEPIVLKVQELGSIRYCE